MRNTQQAQGGGSGKRRQAGKAQLQNASTSPIRCNEGGHVTLPTPAYNMTFSGSRTEFS